MSPSPQKANDIVRHLDLFSGIGGFALAARRVGWDTVAFCEIDPYCQKVLAKHWPGVPIHSDVRELTGDAVGPVDIITGGYPCQPFSLAGKRGGSGDDRHLWPEFARLIRELRPRWVVGENVTGHVTMGLDDVLADMEGLGYACETFVLPACAVDAKHRRDRVWITAHAIGERRRTPEVREPRGGQDVPDTAGGRCRQGHQDAGGSRQGAGEAEEWGGLAEPCRWLSEPDVGRVAHGVPNRLDRIRALGNAIVPELPEIIFRAIDSLPHRDTNR